jgi:YfiH family protein
VRSGPDGPGGRFSGPSRHDDAVSGWQIQHRGGVCLVRCLPLARVSGVEHAFSTRRGSGGTRFDLGSHGEAPPGVARDRRAFLAAAGLGERRPAVVRQEHGSTVIDADALAPGSSVVAADGIVATAAGSREWAPAVRWADCVPVLLVARDGRAVAAVHSGWRGTVAGVVPHAVARLQERGFPPESLVAALGPAIGACCYEVGEEVAAAVAGSTGAGPKRGAARGRGRLTLDLRQAVRTQLRGAGLGGDSIHVAPWCTSCAADLFFSYRREGGAAGRQMACLGWPPGGPP